MADLQEEKGVAGADNIKTSSATTVVNQNNSEENVAADLQGKEHVTALVEKNEASRSTTVVVVVKKQNSEPKVTQTVQQKVYEKKISTNNNNNGLNVTTASVSDHKSDSMDNHCQTKLEILANQVAERKKKKRAEMNQRPRRRGGRYCAAPNCKKYSGGNPGLSFFRFPKDDKRCRQWVINSRVSHFGNMTAEQLHRSKSMCANHFEGSQFTNDYKDRLNWNAIPTLFDVPNPPPRITPKRPLPRGQALLLQGIVDKYPNADPKATATLQLSGVTLSSQPSTDVGTISLPVAAISNLSDISVTPAVPAVKEKEPAAKPARAPPDPKVRALRRKVKCLNAKVNRMQRRATRNAEKRRQSKEECIKCLSHHLSGPTLEFMKTQIKLSGRTMAGLRFQPHDIAIAYSLYNASPKCYRLLSKLFVLPSTSTLKKSINECVVGAEETQVQLPENVPSAGEASSSEEDEKLSDEEDSVEENVEMEIGENVECEQV